MKLIEVNGKKINELMVLSDGVTYDFYSDEDENKTIDFVIDNFIIKESSSFIYKALKFKEDVRKNGIDINCVSIRNSYKDLKIEASSIGKSLTGKMGKFAYFKEPITKSNESNKEVLDVFCRMIDVQLEFYNKTCIKEYKLTMDDIANHLIKKIKK